MTKLAKVPVAQMQGHRMLQHTIMILCQLYELVLLTSDAVVLEAVVQTVLKFFCEAPSARGVAIMEQQLWIVAESFGTVTRLTTSVFSEKQHGSVATLAKSYTSQIQGPPRQQNTS